MDKPVNYDIIILMGTKGVGKDTCAKYLSDKIGWKTYAFSKPVKETAKIMFHLTDEEVNDEILKETPMPKLHGRSPRMIMQFIYKTLFTDCISESMPEYGKLFFVHHMERSLNTDAKSPNIIITDMRSPDYADYLQKKYRTLIIKIVRATGYVDNHISETEVDNFKLYDYIVENNATMDELHTKLDEILKIVGY